MKNKLLPLLAILVVILFGITGYHFLTGWPPLLMMFIAIVIGLLITYLSYIIFGFIAKGLKKIPSKYKLAVISGLTSLISLKLFGFGWPNEIYCPAVVLGILGIVGIFWFINKKSTISLVFGLIFLIGLGTGVYLLIQNGKDPYAQEIPRNYLQYDTSDNTQLGLENPATLGSSEVSAFTYGSGTDIHREEYATGITYKTPTVDASFLLPEWKGKKKKWREKYWDFGVQNFPLNGRVYMPIGEGPFPLTLIVHGNHSMIDYSDDGYGYLGNVLASKGIIAVSVDENFVNGHWSGDFRGKEMPVRAWLLLKHLEQWRQWNMDSTHELYGKIDMNNIMLVGHSRGGEAVSIAAAFNQLPFFPDQAKQAFDFDFNIKGVVSIAPTDYRYGRKMVLKDVNYLSLQGSYDSDEVSFWGMRPYRRLSFTDSLDFFKAGVYLHHANHGQFNSTWGKSDFGAPAKWLLNLAPLLEDKEQQEAAKVFIVAFAEAALKNNTSYLPIFKNIGLAREWLPKEFYLTHFATSKESTLIDFEDDIDITTAKDSIKLHGYHMALWKEENLQTRDENSQDNNAVILGWDYKKGMKADSLSVYEIEFPTERFPKIGVNGELKISIGAGNKEWLKTLEEGQEEGENQEEKEDREEKLHDFTIRITDSLGLTSAIKVSAIKQIAPRLKTRFTKFKFLDKQMIGDEWEVQLQTFHFPLKTFIGQNLELDVQHLKKIEFIFDQTLSGVVVLDDIGFAPLE